MSDIAFSAAMDSSAVEKAYAQIIKENGKLREEMSKLATQSRQAATTDREHKKLQIEASKKLQAEQQKLEQSAAKLRERNRTDFEKYKIEKNEAFKLLQAGTIKEEEYRRELQRLAKQYKDITPQAKARAAALKQEAQAAKEATASEKELLQQSKGQASTAQSVIAGWSGTAKAFGVAGGAATALIATLNKLRDAQREAVAAAADETVSVDTLARRLQIQNGLTDPQRMLMSRSVLGQAMKAGATAEEGFGAATQLVSSGFVDPIKSGTLGTILDLKGASNFQGTPEDLIKGIAQTLNAYGMQRTNQNARAIGMSVQSLFKMTDLQLTDLQEFAKNASVFKGAGMGIDESLAGFTALREVMPSGEAATGLRNFTAILQGAGATKSATDALGSMGLQPGQVDFVGENLTTVLERLRDATKGMAEEDRNSGLIKLFGRENFAVASLLMNNPGRIAELQAVQADTGQFEADVRTSRSSMQADRNRIALRTQMSQLDRAAETHAADIAFKTKEAILKNEREAAWTKGLLPGAAASAAQQLRWVGDLLPSPGIFSQRSQIDPELFGETAPVRADRETRAAESKAEYRRRMGLPPADADDELKKQTRLLERLVEQQAGGKQAGAAVARRTKQGESGP